MTPLIGAILVGGRSSRMGRDKAEILVDGVTMRERVRAALLPLCSRVVLVGGAGADVVDDGSGPLAGVRALLSSGMGDRYLVCAVDQPLVDTPLLQRLAEAEGEGVCFFCEPLPVCVSASRLPALIGQERMKSVATVELPVDDEVTRKLVNVNTPAELAALALRK